MSFLKTSSSPKNVPGNAGKHFFQYLNDQTSLSPSFSVMRWRSPSATTRPGLFNGMFELRLCTPPGSRWFQFRVLTKKVCRRPRLWDSTTRKMQQTSHMMLLVALLCCLTASTGFSFLGGRMGAQSSSQAKLIRDSTKIRRFGPKMAVTDAPPDIDRYSRLQMTHTSRYPY